MWSCIGQRGKWFQKRLHFCWGDLTPQASPSSSTAKIGAQRNSSTVPNGPGNDLFLSRADLFFKSLRRIVCARKERPPSQKRRSLSVNALKGATVPTPPPPHNRETQNMGILSIHIDVPIYVHIMYIFWLAFRVRDAGQLNSKSSGVLRGDGGNSCALHRVRSFRAQTISRNDLKNKSGRLKNKSFLTP